MPEKIPTNPDDFSADTTPVPEAEDAKTEKPKKDIEKEKAPEILKGVEFGKMFTKIPGDPEIMDWQILGKSKTTLLKKPHSYTPTEGETYDVEVVYDSNPESKTEGYREVEVIAGYAKKEESKEKTIETSAEFEAFEEKILEYMERLRAEGADENSVAQGLAGLDSDKAWELRDRLLAEGADINNIAVGLAGLDSDKAWHLRESMLLGGADKGHVARGLAGVDSERAWKLRESLTDEGFIDSVSQSLAGLDSDKAWEFRERLLKDGANEGFVAQGLAGLNSDKAWELRERLLLEGVDKGSIAAGLSGDYITFVWQLKAKREGLKKGLSAEGKGTKEMGSTIADLAKSRETKETEKGIIKNVIFEKREIRRGTEREIEYRSSDRGRKIIFLDKESLKSLMFPKAGNQYDVKVIQDTDPSDRMKGKYIVKIIGESAWDNDVLDEEVPIKLKEKEPLPEHPYAIEVDKETQKLYILETELPINPKGGELVPKKEKFKYFTLDRETLETAEKVATAVERGEPLLLEGETSTSKTSTIEYMAMRTNNEVIRLNLNGQSDTSELIGKFIPNDGQLQIKYEEIIRNPELLKNESREILSSANAQGRALTLIESQKIAQAEGLKIPDWRWSDGLDVRAKKEGKWLILDEINLAETQILERLNSQLEKNPSITLSENGGIIVRKFTDEDRELKKQGKLQGVEELNPNFRIFATMNPAEYSGRSPMSPAYKDRWTSYRFVKTPDEKSYEQMMNFMVFGEQPEVEIRGKKYSGEKEASKLATLEDIPNFRTFIPKMAKFQAKIEDLARKREIGKGKKEKYIFTRRGLTEFMEFINSKSIVDRKTRKKITIEDAPKDIILRAIQYYYLDKISDAYDLIKVNDLLDSIGISERKWTHSFEGPKKPKVAEKPEGEKVKKNSTS